MKNWNHFGVIYGPIRNHAIKKKKIENIKIKDIRVSLNKFPDFFHMSALLHSNTWNSLPFCLNWIIGIT